MLKLQVLIKTSLLTLAAILFFALGLFIIIKHGTSSSLLLVPCAGILICLLFSANDISISR